MTSFEDYQPWRKVAFSEKIPDMLYFLTALVGATQLLLGLLGVYVSIKPQPRERHKWLIGGFVLLAFIGIGLNIYQQARASSQSAKDREEAIVQTSTRVSAEVSKSVSKSVTDSVSDQYRGTINTLQGANARLEAELREQGKKVDAIGNSNIVTGKNPIKVEIANGENVGQPPLEIRASEIPVEPNLQYGKAAREVILTTNRVMDGAHASIHCLSKINNGSAQIAGATVMMGGSGMGTNNTFEVNISSPNWSPARPLVVTLYFDGPDWKGCTITPRL